MATKSRLKAVDPKAAEPSKPKILIYGKPGVGKTWTSLDFPNCYYIDTEGGADLEHYTDKLKASGGMYFGVEQGSLDFDEIIGQVQALATEKHEFKTLIIDSISKIFNMEISKEAERLGDKDAFGASKKPAVAHMRRLINWLSRIDMNVIIISHEKAEWKNGEQIGETFDCWDRLEYELHLCLNIIKQGNSRKARVRKTRLLGFPDATVFEWSYAAFAERYGKDIIENDVKQLVLANNEQIGRIKDLLELVRMPEGWFEKCLKAANADTIEEVDTEKAQKMIEALETKTAIKGEVA